ncbi:hypothetical protein [Nonomuraea sp. NPDC050691]|uniref:hypothetical protein n=1 Tax=Nonomuraea sp. NPDC050691 TaxID=3155661 RepID=UPI0033DF8626
MRRWIAGAVAVSALAMAPPAFAQAKPVDPVGALKKQFVAGQGVKLTESSRTWVSGKAYIGANRQGLLEFATKGIIAAETTRTPVFTPSVRKELDKAAAADPETATLVETLTQRTYMLSKDKTLYVNGGLFSTMLPEHKLWVGMPGRPTSGAYGDQLINVFEPGTLKYLLSSAKSVKGAQYRGTMTFAQLYKLSPTFRTEVGIRPTGSGGRTVISWRITLDARKLVKRVAIDWSMKVTKKVTIKGQTETRYSDYGTAVAITAPPANQVAGLKDLGKNLGEPPMPIDPDYVTVPPDDEGNTY